MKITSIYQTLENRGNEDEILDHGPYKCYLHDKEGKEKKGIRSPWLGEGFYFWDSLVDDAHWWGERIYGRGNYVIFRSTYDTHNSRLFDTVGDVEQCQKIKRIAEQLADKFMLKRINFSRVLDFMKEHGGFNKKYSAIRVWPFPIFCDQLNSRISFPGNEYGLPMLSKIQICFYDQSLFEGDFTLEFKPNIPAGFTI